MGRPWVLLRRPSSLPSRERGLKSACRATVRSGGGVAPFTGAWIEMGSRAVAKAKPAVAPFTGAWIEISPCWTAPQPCWSLPSRERGLKLLYHGFKPSYVHVAPFTGAWIEIPAATASGRKKSSSLPSRERGLKFDDGSVHAARRRVAPFTGAWIEIRRWECPCCPAACRSLHGSVD